MKKVTAVLVGAGGRGNEYSTYSLEHPDELQMVAVVEPVKERRELYAKKYGIAPENCFSDYPELFARGKIADCAFICTQDQMHYEPTMMAIDCGYDILLEKPMSPNLDECVAMANHAAEKGVLLSLCYVLRFTEIFQKIKQLLDDGEIGRLIAIQHNENVGFWHMAHSFVRGHWRNSDETSPMILAKSCHDMDLLYYLVGSKPVSVASFGSLNYFNKESAPNGSTDRCTDDCKYRDNCPYDATKLYLGKNTAWPVDVVSLDPSLDARTKALETGPYGRCVHRCDNNVVDNQVSIINFENGVNVAFTMCGFTKGISRTIKLMGSHGQLEAKLEDNTTSINLYKFQNAGFIKPDQDKYPFCVNIPVNVNEDIHGHGGGDHRLVADFINNVRSKSTNMLSSARNSVYSHIMAFAAEKSRLENRVVNISEYNFELED